MKSFVDKRFWRAYDKLPADVQRQADVAYALWLKNPFHPSLVSSQYSGAKKFDFCQKSNFWVGQPQFIEKIPSLRFKRVDDQDPIFSARIGRGYRALGWRDRDTFIWFWIGGHDEYDRILG